MWLADDGRAEASAVKKEDLAPGCPINASVELICAASCPALVNGSLPWLSEVVQFLEALAGRGSS